MWGWVIAGVILLCVVLCCSCMCREVDHVTNVYDKFGSGNDDHYQNPNYAGTENQNGYGDGGYGGDGGYEGRREYNQGY